VLVFKGNREKEDPDMVGSSGKDSLSFLFSKNTNSEHKTVILRLLSSQIKTKKQNDSFNSGILEFLYTTLY
jgi:hypothetical protein